MEIEINGVPTAIPGACSLLELLQHLGVDSGRVAVELNGYIVKKAQWPEQRVGPGAKVEIVHFVGGGSKR
jgi:thiamine biosynthesis protein ThiS